MADRALTAHPRMSVSSLCSLNQSFADDLAMWQELGVENVGLISPKLEAVGWDAAKDLVVRAGLRVSNIATEERVITEALHFASAVGADPVYLTSGRAAGPSWEEAAAAFRDRIGPAAAMSKELGVRLAVEPTNPFRAERSFLFCLRDAVDVARAAGISVVLDVYSCWYERGFAELVHENTDLLGLVQICDYALGTFDTPNRAVIGDGNIPLERLLRTLLDAGYQGAFDLEIMGPRIDEEGYANAIRRSVERASELLDRLGA
ncbi:MAG: sugar phosphate isomerase/epimerase family protein [Candidatus Binatia bacterium]